MSTPVPPRPPCHPPGTSNSPSPAVCVVSHPPSRGPKFHLLAHAVLSLAEVQDGFRTHDLAIANSGE